MSLSILGTCSILHAATVIWIAQLQSPLSILKLPILRDIQHPPPWHARALRAPQEVTAVTDVVAAALEACAYEVSPKGLV